MNGFKVEFVDILAAARPPHRELSDEERRRRNEDRRRRNFTAGGPSVPSNEDAEKERGDASAEESGNSGSLGDDAGTEASSIDEWA